MDGNKDEASRCIKIAEAALASGDKRRALKFIRIAQRLNCNLSVDDLLASCENLESESATVEEKPVDRASKKSILSNSANGNVEHTYTEENVKLIREVKRTKDFYDILGVEKSCTVEEIRKAYRKLSLKVHPDKNKAPGSEEAFKKVCKAFKCLSEEESRRHYDQTGPEEDFEQHQQQTVRRRRRRSTYDMYDDEFDPEMIFRSFFGQNEMFRTAHVYRTRGPPSQQRDNTNRGGFNPMILLQILPFLFIFLLAYLPYSEPEYSLQKNYSYQFPKYTESYGVEFFVKSTDFDETYPPGSDSRENLEVHVVREYKNVLGRYCQMELQRRQWNRNYPTPYCEKLQNFGVV
ncbi:hypothetical protein GIB67_009807 [Kingdonia uniflora]|uniref:J domain-containing protein n=1 Tax=Kingdonia uniflora TaxID=39325 RepID=A0A7J7MGW3_9MAGN|nr:hypothetical protein GIB67_009807 [Kingdonia uniflora]